MATENNGGAAFPCQSGFDFKNERVTTTSEGMTLRDYFAAKALQGNLASQDGRFYDLTANQVDVLALWSYMMADAMLRASKE